jgi:ABC-type nickel/cobalt efflux system permease component RcnA
MTAELHILLLTAASIGFFHTLLGPDHYLPFIVMSKAGKWSKNKTFMITFLCGVAHVFSSLALGFIGIIFGITVSKLEFIEGFRGDIASWMLIAFGFAYMVWGVKRVYKHKPHSHLHIHSDGTYHDHKHIHSEEHTHVHRTKYRTLTPWILFTIFIFGPCEPLIPLLMYPAAKYSMEGLLLVTAVFSVATISTMLSVVSISVWGFRFVSFAKLERWTHALAGFTILISGLAIVFLGL